MRLSLRPLLPGETDWEKITAFALPAVALIGLACLKFHVPLPPCALKHFTGIPCAGCGATRATVAMSRGHWNDALYLNPATTLGFFAFAIYWVYSVTILTSKPGRRLRIDDIPRRTGMMIRLGIGLVFLANWLWVLTHLPESPWLAK